MSDVELLNVLTGALAVSARVAAPLLIVALVIGLILVAAVPWISIGFLD